MLDGPPAPKVFTAADLIQVAGAYLGNEGGGCLMAREACCDLAMPLFPCKKVMFTAISHNYYYAHVYRCGNYTVINYY